MSNAAQTVSLVGRYFNALCYLVGGITVLSIVATKGGGVWIVLIGIAMTLYGLYVGLTRGSYWVSTLTYVVPILGIAIAFAS